MEERVSWLLKHSEMASTWDPAPEGKPLQWEEAVTLLQPPQLTHEEVDLALQLLYTTIEEDVDYYADGMWEEGYAHCFALLKGQGPRCMDAVDIVLAYGVFVPHVHREWEKECRSFLLLQWAAWGDLKRAKMFSPNIWREDECKEWVPSMMYVAARHGHVGILQYLHKHYNFKEIICDNALHWETCGGQLHVFKYLGSKCKHLGHDMKHACSDAAAAGQLDILRWLHDEGFSWDADTSTPAAASGHWDVLRSLLKEGCPCNENTYCRWEAAPAPVAGRKRRRVEGHGYERKNLSVHI